MKTVAVYLRVSTEDQKTDLQKNAIIHYCNMKGIPSDSLQWFIDQGESGSKISRPSFNKMMEAARSGTLSAVLTWKFDRIGRSTVHLIQVLEELKTLEVDFISLTENVDTSSPMGKMIFGIFAVLAQFEREQLIMRTKAGMEAARSRGSRIGRPEKTGPISRATLYRRKKRERVSV